MIETRETYRQYMIGQLQIWEGKIAHLRAGLQVLDGLAHYEYEVRLREVERLNRKVFSCYADLLLAGEREWDQRREVLDGAAGRLQEMLDLFVLQPAYN
jgi:hypothetical protein